MNTQEIVAIHGADVLYAITVRVYDYSDVESVLTLLDKMTQV